ncbi:MAG TPA: hypothetical protein PKA10_03150 [Selenomonadales bacterium]|nr:hypothetical protein [Selenomonadales bacterium]
MRKIVLTLITLLALNIGVGFAAPINDLSQGQTAIGAGTDTFYLEHKLTDSFTLGFQNVDRHSDMNDIYGQFRLTSNLRGIVGTRDLDYGGSDAYLGLAVNAPIAPGWDGYASMVAGSDFKELQVGANIGLVGNVDLNLNYYSFMPDRGSDKDGIGIGATLKF